MLEKLRLINEQVKQTALEEKRSYYYFGRFLSDVNPSTEIMFIAERPSMRSKKTKKNWNRYGNFLPGSPKGSDSKFVDLLNKYGWGNSYITDIVKSAAPSGRPTDIEIDLYFPYLLEEIDVIKPKKIIALGDNAYQVLTNRLNRLKVNIPVEKIMHPTNLRWAKRSVTIEEQIKSIKI